jgi:AcrR family transcriptional regulator
MVTQRVSTRQGVPQDGYSPGEMTATPWGRADELRSRKLRPGPGLSRELVAENQRERLFAALVAVVAERGYAATNVSDLLDLSGVSRSAFYRYFPNKQECFLAAFDAIVGKVTAQVAEAYMREGSVEDRLMATLDAVAAFVVSQPAASRLAFVDYFAVGPEAMDRVEDATTALQRLILEGFKDVPERAGVPPLVIRGIIGGVRKITHTRLRRGEEAELPKLMPVIRDCALAFQTPSTPLRSTRSGAAPAGVPIPPSSVPSERIFAAMAETVASRGYGGTTVAEVATRASTSLSTFYALFDSKEEAFVAAHEAAVARLLAAAVPAFNRAPDWPHAVRAGLAAFLDATASDESWARLGIVEVLAAGPEAMERRDQAIDMFTSFLQPGLEHAPETDPVVFETIGGAVFNLMFDHIRRRGAHRLPELLPVTTVLALAPFIGTDAAVAVANERTRVR